MTTIKHLNRLRERIIEALYSKNIDSTGSVAASLEVRGNELLGNDYIYYLDKGRGPGKFPPPQNIREWVRNKLGIENPNGIAYLIGRKIAREGTEIFKDNSKGIGIDLLVDEMVEELTEDIMNESVVEVLKWL